MNISTPARATEAVLSPVILKLNKSEGRPPPVLEIDEDDLAVLVEEVLDVLAAYVGRQVAHVYPALRVGLGHICKHWPKLPLSLVQHIYSYSLYISPWIKMTSK